VAQPSAEARARTEQVTDCGKYPFEGEAKAVRLAPVQLPLVDQSPSAKDTIIAIVGSSAGLAGLVLVFLGVLVTSFQSLLGNVRDATLSRYRNATWISLGVFALALASMSLGVTWLLAAGGHTFYVLVLIAFFAQVGALGLVATYVTARVLLRG
jgi:hypothetical protein